MKTRLLVPLLILIFVVGLFPTPVQADGIIIPTAPPPCLREPCPPPPQPIPIPQLDIRYHHVTVKIDNQVAVTHVDQVFYNPNDYAVEGTYLFPLPQDAAVSNFTLWVDGQPIQGEVLDADQARQTYEDMVSSLRDPALLEYADRGAVRARIFPIPPQGERRIELEYSQTLTAENGLVRYVYPLNTEKFSAQPLESVSISVEVHSGQPIRAVYSPTHSISVSRPDEFSASAGYEANNVLPDSDFALYYSLGESQAFHLLTYRDPSDAADPDGFFLLLLAPRPDAAVQAVPKDVLLVLDHSGSMDGEKFRQAGSAARYILEHLNAEDRFNLITFSTGVETYAPAPRAASEAPQAEAWLNGVSAQGSTDINRALLEAAGMTDKERPTYLIFLTDGLPTEGVTQRDQILQNVAASAPSNLRLFAFGVGYDVDTLLLDSLAQQHHGAVTYVRPGDALDEMLSSFYAKISAPVLTDLKLDFGSAGAYDVYPNPLPDLFSGSQIVVVGRYRTGGNATVTLTGKTADGQTQTFSYPQQAFLEKGTSQTGLEASLPRLWATRKVGTLLNQIRLQGPDQETIDQIVRLSIRYGIVTPYTSYLVSEPVALGGAAQERIARDAYNETLIQPTVPASGQAAVEQSAGQSALAGAQAPAPAPTSQATGNAVRIVGAHTFVLQDGVWTDTTFDPQTMKTVKVPFLSEDYFKLSEARPEIAAAFALGERVIVLSDGTAYEVVPADTLGSSSLTLPPTYTPTPPPTPTVVTPTPLPPTATAPVTRVAPTQTPAGPTATAVPEPPAPDLSGSVCPGAILILVLALLASVAKR